MRAMVKTCQIQIGIAFDGDLQISLNTQRTRGPFQDVCGQGTLPQIRPILECPYLDFFRNALGDTIMRHAIIHALI